MLHTYTDRKGRLVVRAWWQTPEGRVVLTLGWLLLVGLGVAWACETMPVPCDVAYCEMVRP